MLQERSEPDLPSFASEAARAAAPALSIACAPVCARAETETAPDFEAMPFGALELQALGNEAWRGRSAAAVWPFALLTGALHALVIMLALMHLPMPLAAGDDEAAITVELVTEAALDTRSQGSRGAIATPAGQDGDIPGEVAKSQVAVTAQQAAPAERTEAEEKPASAMPPAEPADLVTGSVPERAERNSETERNPEPRADEPPRAESAEGRAEQTIAAQDAVAAGGGTASGQEAQASQEEGGARTKAGELSRFAAEVHSALARKRQRPPGAAGKVAVRFGLTSAGAVRFVTVSRTSGNAKLDRAAVERVRSVGFPTPPPGVPDGALDYVIELEFR